MARYQKRHVRLKKGAKVLHLQIEHGHVYQFEKPNQGMIAHCLYDEKAEIALLGKLLRRAVKDGYVVVEDSGVVAKKTPKKPANMTAATWRWVQDADEMLRAWREDDYDNFKDAIFDARSMLGKAPETERARIARLQKMLDKATSDLRRLAASDPAIAEYARGLIPPVRARKGTAKKKAVKKAASKATIRTARSGKSDVR